MVAPGLALALFLTGAPPAPMGPCTVQDERGQPFRTCFDPGTGFELGVAVSGRQGPGLSVTPAASAAILYRTSRESVSKEGSLWFNEHRFLDTRVQPFDDQKSLRATAYRALFRRHLTEGFILVPSAKPIRLPFPFDVAMTASMATYERRVFDGRGFTLETTRAAVLLDPLRSGTGKNHLMFGPAMSHTLRSDGDRVRQEIVPLTSLVLDLGFETDDGWWVLRLSGIAGGVFEVDPTQTWRFSARGEALAERLLFAVNDTPLWLSARFVYSANDAGPSRKSEWAATVGLTMRAFGR